VKRQRLCDRVVIGRRVRADLFELADVLAAGVICRRERPQLFDVLPADVQKTSSDGREEPFVKAGAVKIASQILRLEGEVREGVRAVNHRFDSPAARFVANRLHGKNLPRQVRDVAEVKHLRRRSYRREQAV
jgi:hypothetical protein